MIAPSGLRNWRIYTLLGWLGLAVGLLAVAFVASSRFQNATTRDSVAALVGNSCADDINAPSGAITEQMASRLIREVPSEGLLAYPTRAAAEQWAEAMAKASETVTKRKAGPIVFAYARGQVDAMMTKGITAGTLVESAEVIVKAALSLCNARGQ
jgi:hypothetical protein